MTNNGKRCAVYLRVSTDDQHTENQMPALKELAERQGWKIVKVYSEEASAWRSGHQYELKELLIRASHHDYDVILVWSLDRLTREGIGSIMNLVNTFKGYGAELVSLQESWTMQGDPFMKDLLFSIVAWVAKFESDRRSERVKAGIERRRKKGLPVGRIQGSKDNGKRRRTGYLLRYADRRKTNPPKNGT